VAPARLLALLSERNLTIAFQPIVCLRGAEIFAFEALARPSAESGYSGPMDLFDEASSAGLMWEVEELVREQVLEHASSFPEGVTLFMNNSPEVFADPRFVGSLKAKMSEHPELTPARLVLEVTERAEGENVDALVAACTSLKALGYQIAIDDVGAGTSGLTRVMQLRPHWLKLDRALIDHLDRDPYKLNMVKFLAHFANLSGVNIVAEGIERRDELTALVGAGVRYAQGFYLARPHASYRLLSEGVVRSIREASSLRSGGPIGRSNHGPLTRIMQQAETAQAGQTLGDLAGTLVRAPEKNGFVVMDGRRFVGWCWRDTILSLAATDQRTQQVGHFTRPGQTTLPPDASLKQALASVSVRDESEILAPIVVADGEAILGVVWLRALLSAAAGNDSGSIGSRLHAVSGLPGRVAADLHVRDLLARARATGGSTNSSTNGATGASAPAAAIIDVRAFDSYNVSLGYELGDKLILDLSLMLQEQLAAVPDVYLAHLGEDRFLVTGQGSALIPTLEGLVQRMGTSRVTTLDWLHSSSGEHEAPVQDDQTDSASRDASGALPPADETDAIGNERSDDGFGEHTDASWRGDGDLDAESAGPVANNDARGSLSAFCPVGLRVLVLDGVLERAQEPRELYQVEQQLRRMSLERERGLSPTLSVLARDERALAAARSLRKAG
jgi:EAL domain-containing protein (putative c-di-GMP-specific phosphodiesterase class I)/GGDEF domain-containing protein